MRGFVGMLVTMALARAAAAQPAGDVDVAAVRDRMTVFADGKGHYLVGIHLDPERDSPTAPGGSDAYKEAARFFFHGSERELVRIGTAASFAVGERDGRKVLEYWFRDRRVWPAQGDAAAGQGGWGVFRVAGDTGVVGCTVAAATYTRLPAARARAILERARFRPPAVPERNAHLLARDGQGIYYYVDQLKDGMGFRLFVGRRGAMKQMKLIDAVEDSEGTLMVTARGSLSAHVDRRQAAWVAGKTTTALTFVPVADNQRLIFTQLGVYDGVRFGTPCD